MSHSVVRCRVCPCLNIPVLIQINPQDLSGNYPSLKVREEVTGPMRSLVQENVSEIMNPYLITVSPYDTLAQAYELLVKNKIRRLPVVDNNKKLIGILTLKDVLEAKPSDIKHTLYIDDIYKHLSGLTVVVAMTSKPITIYQTSTVGNAAELMLEHKIGGLPVLDAGDGLAGLITESDIFRLIVRRWRDENYFKSAVS